MENIIKSLNWRYAVKIFDKNRKLTAKQVDFLKESVNLTASSLGLQPFKVAVISSEEIKQKLYKVSYDQAQIITASELFVFCANENVDEQYADKYLENISKTRNVTRLSLKGYEGMVKGFIKNTKGENKVNWAARQAYIAIGNLLTTAAMAEIDACPMEGFEAEKYAEILGLKEKGLKPFALVALGYRSCDDKYGKLAKVRRPIEEGFINY